MRATHMQRFTSDSTVSSASVNVPVPYNAVLRSVDVAVIGTGGPVYFKVGLVTSDLGVSGGTFIHHMASGFSRLDADSCGESVEWAGELSTVVDLTRPQPQVNVLYSNRTGTDQQFSVAWSYDDERH